MMDQLGTLASLPEQLQDLFQQILDNTSAVIYVKDTDYQYLVVNHQFERLFGVSREKIAGQTDFDLFPADLAQVFRENDEIVINRGDVLQCEEIAPHVDGPHNYVSVKFPLRDEFGHIVAMAGISTDITDRVQAKQALDALRHQYEMLLGSVGDGICGLDRHGRVTFVNPAMERLLGVPASQLQGRCHKSFILAPPRKEQECPVSQVLQGEGTQRVAEARFLRADDSILPVEYVAAPLQEGDQTVGAVLTCRVSDHESS